MYEFTVYTSRERPVEIDELRARLGSYGLPATVMADSDPGARTGRWFVTLDASPDKDEDTMLDAQMVVLDVNHDAALVKGSAGSLLMDFEGADGDDDMTEVANRLRKACQSVFCSVSPHSSSGLRILQLATLAACLEVGGGVLHDSTKEEYFLPSTVGSFLTRELGADANPILSALGKS